MPPERNLMERAEKTYAFLCEMERKGTAFQLEDITEVAGYTRGTVDSYRTKKWSTFLISLGNGTYLCRGILSYPLESFLRLHNQKHVPILPPETTTVYFVQVIFLWYVVALGCTILRRWLRLWWLYQLQVRRS